MGFRDYDPGISNQGNRLFAVMVLRDHPWTTGETNRHKVSRKCGWYCSNAPDSPQITAPLQYSPWRKKSQAAI
jgi:hypothetical protein